MKFLYLMSNKKGNYFVVIQVYLTSLFLTLAAFVITVNCSAVRANVQLDAEMVKKLQKISNLRQEKQLIFKSEKLGNDLLSKITGFSKHST